MKRILIWGTGTIAREVLSNGICGEIIGFIQTNKTAQVFMDQCVYGIEEIPEEYDFIIVANSFSGEIYDICQRRNIPLKKVIFLRGIKRQEGYCNLSEIQNILGVKNYTNYCGEFGLTENSFFVDDAKRYRELNTRSSFEIQENYMWPVIQEKYAMAGSLGNYFWQDLWAAKRIVQSGVKAHFDIGSRLDGVIAHLLAAGIDVTMIDVRKFPAEVKGLHTIVDDATTLHQIPDESIESMSALCSLEHFGLGRYGDPVDPEACFKCFHNIQRKLKKGGRLYISVPVGKERVEFNAHRVFYADTVVKSFSFLSLEEFSCAAEEKIEYNVEIHKHDEDLHNGEYRYGLFLFVKK
jgi:hypothetical protein